MDTKDFKKGQLIGGKFGEGTGYGIFDHYIDDNKTAIHLSIVVADDKCLIDVDEWVAIAKLSMTWKCLLSKVFFMISVLNGILKTINILICLHDVQS